MPTFTISSGEDDEFGELQRLVDAVFASGGLRDSMDLQMQAEICDACADVLEVVNLLPAGAYTRAQMADQLNSIICGHGWGTRFGTVA